MKDFLSSVVLILLSAFVLFESRTIYVKAGKQMYVSPALIPTLLGSLLLILSVTLLFSSLRDGGIGARCRETKETWKAIVSDSNTPRMLIGLAFMALYTFVLLGRLPFAASTIIFMVLLMKYLGAGSWPKIVGISVVITGLIILLFEICFRVPLP